MAIIGAWQATIVDALGNIVPGAQVEVRRETGGLPLEPLFSDRDGLVPLGNPFPATSEAFAQFFCAGGPFRIRAFAAGLERLWRYVPVGTAGERDDGFFAQVASNLLDLASRKTAFDNLSIHGADVASAATLNLDNATGVIVDVTGVTTVTAITLADGRERVVRFTGALTLTHGASLVLPGAQSIVTAAGDFAIFRGYAAGVVRLVAYQRADGQPLPTGTATIASAATVDLGSVRAQNISVSGTTTVTSFGTSAPVGALKSVTFQGILTLTNGANLILPTGANIVTAAGDSLISRYEGASVWRVVNFQRASGAALVGGSSAGYRQVLQTLYTANADLTTQTPYDDTIPTNSEGTQILSQAITLEDTNNQVELNVEGFGGSVAGARHVISIFRGTTCVYATTEFIADNDSEHVHSATFIDAPAAVGPHTYTVRIGPGVAGTIRMNGTAAARRFGGAAAVVLTVKEVIV